MSSVVNANSSRAVIDLTTETDAAAAALSEAEADERDSDSIIPSLRTDITTDASESDFEFAMQLKNRFDAQRKTEARKNQQQLKRKQSLPDSSLEVDASKVVESSKSLSTSSLPSARLGFYVNRIAGLDNRHSIGLGDLLSGEVQRCVLLSYEVDLEWLFDSYPQLLRYPRVDFVYNHSLFSDSKPHPLPDRPNCILYNPHRYFEYGKHHSKIILSFYATGVRFAVMSANLKPHHWSSRNNCIYVQDFPRKSASSPSTSTFEQELTDYFGAYHRCSLRVDEIAQFDWKGATVQLIPSVPGQHTNYKLDCYGHMKLRKELRKEQLDARFIDAPIIAQFSSFGSLHEKWLSGEFRDSLSAHTTRSAAELLPPPIHLIWPTVEYVRSSLEGWQSGGGLPCSSKNMKPFLRNYLHIFEAHSQLRHRASPHCKSYFRANRTTGELAWAVVTSANMSLAAWGSLDKSQRQLFIRSYEMGVLFTPATYAQSIQYLQQNNLMDFTCSLPSTCTSQFPSNTVVHSVLPPSSTSSATISLPRFFLSTSLDAASDSNLQDAKRTKLSEGVDMQSSSAAATSSTSLSSKALTLVASSSANSLIRFPFPFNPFARKYQAGEDGWTWDVPRTQLDCHGQTYGSPSNDVPQNVTHDE